MKHSDLIRQLRRLARAYGFQLENKGGTRHEKWRAGDATAIVPRHKEVGERLAQVIIEGFEEDLNEQAEGKDEE